MPYIKDKDKIKALKDGASVPGEVAYLVTEIVRDYLNAGPHNYAEYAEVIGVLELTKLEIVRRIVSPYEDQKIHENGDVFTQVQMGRRV